MMPSARIPVAVPPMDRVTGASTAGTAPPRIISWNVTLRCPLRCRHCYADAGRDEAEGVLTTEEAFRVVDQIRATGNPVVVLSGGEPLMREDLLEIARYGNSAGLRMGLGTSGMTFGRDTAACLRESGIRTVAVSLDSADPDVHDRFRGRKGSWFHALKAIRLSREEGLQVQINTTIRSPDIAGVNRVLDLGTGLGVRDFQLFFPVPAGRADPSGPGTPEAYERLIRQAISASAARNVRIRPTCAPQFRRIADRLGIRDPGWGRGCIAGIHYCRISVTGEVTPCPFLPVSGGNVKRSPFREIWDRSPVFAALRDPGRLGGRCGRCEYREVCGGCRARAYGMAVAVPGTCGGPARPGEAGDALCGEDPWCPYRPGEDGP